MTQFLNCYPLPVYDNWWTWLHWVFGWLLFDGPRWILALDDDILDKNVVYHWRFIRNTPMSTVCLSVIFTRASHVRVIILGNYLFVCSPNKSVTISSILYCGFRIWVKESKTSYGCNCLFFEGTPVSERKLQIQHLPLPNQIIQHNDGLGLCFTRE